MAHHHYVALSSLRGTEQSIFTSQSRVKGRFVPRDHVHEVPRVTGEVKLTPPIVLARYETIYTINQTQVKGRFVPRDDVRDR